MVYGYLHFDFESKKLTTRQIGVQEHIAWAGGRRTITV